ncbi:thiosulfate sulfurtransferase GlpE [Zooshikella harenae]|uniref:Thiosulfate sulfurtransferase GlpE n=1 Tax=Zooshikella harenae TaxID=2827238 RepID=A0ABS5Z920_9GAMM|nr:thiosulfate sulfurtransferase GlpE [Zooshikella harenae]MBU2710543.1 thiosulfate sulfurtransferase GlpE [Zooshikella harenae]
MEIDRIKPEEALHYLQAGNACFVDIRDLDSFQQGHIPTAQHLDNQTILDFIEDTDVETTIVVYCFHGHSSVSAALYLKQKGFNNIMSLDGGFTLWQEYYPEAVDQ